MCKLLFKTAIFIRDNAKALNLTHLDRTVLISLALRIGNNDNTWITQKALCEECSISERQLRRSLTALNTKNLINSNYIVTKKGKQHTYKFTEVIHNYRTSMSDSEIELMDTTGHQRPVVEGTTGHPCPHPTGHPCPVVPHLSTGQPIEIIEEFEEKDFAKETIENNNNIKTTKKDTKMTLPEWLPHDQWNEFLDHRKQSKSPMSLVAQKRAINFLTQQYENGQDVLKIIDQSIINGWKGLFELKQSRGFTHGRQQIQTYANSRAARLQNYWDDPTGFGSTELVENAFSAFLS